MDTYSRLDAEERHARRLQDTEQALQRGTSLLADARRTVAETEEIGLGTVENLHGQRQQLLAAQATVKETTSKTQEAARTLNGMARRAAHNRIFLYCIIVLLLFFIGLMLWDIFKK